MGKEAAAPKQTSSLKKYVLLTSFLVQPKVPFLLVISIPAFLPQLFGQIYPPTIRAGFLFAISVSCRTGFLFFRVG